MNFKYLMMTAVLAIGLVSCSNDDDNVGGGEGTTPEGTKTTARISLTQKSISTYATTENPTPEESEIKSATLYIFKGGTLKQVVTLPVTGGAASKVIELTTGVHKFYAAVNAPSLPSTAINEPITSVIEKLIEINADISEIANTNTGFFMTNIDGPTTADLEVATEDEAEAGTKNNIRIPVGRAFAKVSVNFIPDYQQQGALTDVEYRVKNNPKKMYFMPVLSSSFQVLTPFFNKPEDELIDPDNYFNNPDPLLNADGASPSYAMENTNKFPKEGNTTYAMIKGTFTPTTTYAADGTTPEAGVEGADFWRIKQSEANGGEYTDKMYRIAPTAEHMLAVGGTDAELAKYTEGKTYYAIWLANNTASTTDGGTEMYTVRRNTFFKVNITSVDGPGANTEGGEVTNPNNPLLTDTYIKASIQVMPWTVIEQNGGI